MDLYVPMSQGKGESCPSCPSPSHLPLPTPTVVTECVAIYSACLAEDKLFHTKSDGDQDTGLSPTNMTQLFQFSYRQALNKDYSQTPSPAFFQGLKDPTLWPPQPGEGSGRCQSQSWVALLQGARGTTPLRLGQMALPVSKKRGLLWRGLQQLGTRQWKR